MPRYAQVRKLQGVWHRSHKITCLFGVNGISRDHADRATNLDRLKFFYRLGAM
ncbi:hypothetical protein SAMN05216298_0346 [Glycomyces sambucus]|uniref:Uncharacterized protein n=1 Tax=Glycomyces sambucus TaxID=380244 RepID=A0A1G9CHX2_9ACTN|nr:hypothetical protein SAMN05216298_0346 [Glycomyces sambucus]